MIVLMSWTLPSFPIKIQSLVSCFNNKIYLCLVSSTLPSLLDRGKTLVLKYVSTMDAQWVWSEYLTYIKDSSQGAADRRKLHNYLCTTGLGNNFKGPPLSRADLQARWNLWP